MELQVYKKSKEFEIVKNLTHAEFMCKCKHPTCTFTLLNERLAQAFDIVRGIWLDPIIVNSGFRCQIHNKEVGGVDDSWHKKGSAMDLVPANEDLLGLYKLAQKFFDVVILYEDKGFIHCQMED